MKTLKRLTVGFSLALVLAGTAFAGEVNTPPCPNPGEVNTPPCTDNQLVNDGPVNQTIVISNEVETVTIATAISAIESLLTVY